MWVKGRVRKGGNVGMKKGKKGVFVGKGKGKRECLWVAVKEKVMSVYTR